jgi:hypothetical protein
MTATGLDQIGRRIQTTMELRPLIEIGTQPIDLDRSIPEAVNGQHRDGMPATRTEEALDSEHAVVSRADVIARVRAMALQPSFVLKWATRTVPRKTFPYAFGCMLREGELTPRQCEKIFRAQYINCTDHAAAVSLLLPRNKPLRYIKKTGEAVAASTL